MQAVNSVHWPGKDTAACFDHTEKIANLAGFMGFRVTITPLPKDPIVECANCANEAKLAAGV